MRRRRMTAAIVVVLAAAAVGGASAAAARGAEPESMQVKAAQLYASLTPAQREKGVRGYDDPQRTQEMFTPGKRVGVQLRDLDESQRAMAVALLTEFTSDYGRQRAEAIAAQEGDGGLLQYYLAFFGEPGEGKSYAWRIAEHHLTIVNVEVHGGGVTEFGPILLGANPPVLFDEEEDGMIGLYKAMTPEERQQFRQRMHQRMHQ